MAAMICWRALLRRQGQCSRLSFVLVTAQTFCVIRPKRNFAGSIWDLIAE